METTSRPQPLDSSATAVQSGRTGPDPAWPGPCHDARALTGASGAAVILLDGKPYVLRITRQGKLILTK